jgi:triosephosphate isomerase
MSWQSLVVGNWKMNGGAASVREAALIAKHLSTQTNPAEVVLCPPAILIARMAEELCRSPIRIGAQDCHWDINGAFTGDHSAEMFAEAGAQFVILGHSERRTHHGESNSDVTAKATAAVRAGLTPIVCVGETLAERREGRTLPVIEAQICESLPDELAEVAFAIAYEPVWAIGSGETPSLDEIAEVHQFVRVLLIERFRKGGLRAPILYGGSVNAANAAAILGVDQVGGALVGGASLRAADFIGILGAVPETPR